MNSSSPAPSRSKKSPTKRGGWIRIVLAFLLGCVLSTTLVLNTHFISSLDPSHRGDHPLTASSISNVPPPLQQQQQQQLSVLHGIKILVAIAAYDFSQLPHLEEVLDGYFDVCASGAIVHVVIHSTVAFPVTLIDVLNSRLSHPNFELKIVLKSPRVRLHLVDFHRPLFYQQVDNYNLFIYTEDDIRVTPKSIAAYLQETRRVEDIVGTSQASNYNVGIVRYEYNFPPDIVINDKTRHATQNVTRVYWEHSWKPPIPKSMDAVPRGPLSKTHVHMANHHQGMFMATPFLLKEWKERPNCRFDVVRDRPGLKNKPSQPAEGTQRVWMSSTMLYGNRHCSVQQVLPMDTFGQLTVLHLPNKNYRRVGKKGRLGGNNAKEPNHELDGSAVDFDLPSPQLLTAMELHVEMRKTWPAAPQYPYKGIQMVNEVEGPPTDLVVRRMAEYDAYVARGGVMALEDMAKTSLVD